MPSIIVHTDPSGIRSRDIYPVESGMMVSEWIMNHWPDGLSMKTNVYLNSTNPDDLLFHCDPENPQDYRIKKNDVIQIVQFPGETAIIIAISLVVGIASTFLLAPNVPIPQNPEFKKPIESPNDSLSGQINIARPLQRIPDIYGKNKVFPDLIAKTFFEFANHIKYVTEYLCIGVGEYLVEEIKSGDTLISNIEGSTATVFGPNTAPSELLDVTESNEVNGQEVFAPNEGGSLDVTAVVNFIGSVINSTDANMNQFSSLVDNDTFTVSGTVSNNGVLTFASFDFEAEIGLYIITVDESLTTESGVNATFVSSSGKSDIIGPFAVPGEPDQVWFDIQAPKGIQNASAQLSIEIDLILERLDAPGGSVIGTETTTVFLIDNTIDPRFYTFKITPGTPGDPYQAKVQRKTNTSTAADFFDQTKWTRLAGVEDVTVSDFGNITSVFIVTKATEQATSIQQRKFNAVVTRKLVTFDTGTQMITVTPTATAKFADAVLHHLTDSKIGNKSASELDLDELYTIQDDLDSVTFYGDTLGRFCRTFSDAKTPVEDEVRTILNAARCMHYQEGQLLRFVRDETRLTRVALFNSRVKGPASESKTIKFFRPGDHDGVELQWIDEATGEGNTELQPKPSGGSNNLRIDGAGIKNFKQAFNRTKYEFDKLKLQRTNVSTKVTQEGILPRINDRVANVDGTNIDAQGGEILSIVTLTVETDSEVDFGVSPTGTVILRDGEGNTDGPRDCIPRTDGVNGFILTESPGFTIFVRNGDIQIGTLYSFFAGPDDDHNVNDYLIGQIDPQENGYVNLILVNYRDEIYDADTTDPLA